MLEAPSGDNEEPKHQIAMLEDYFEPYESLEALVAEGDLDKATLIFPNTPISYETNKRWIDFCKANKNSIVHSYGNPDRSDLQTKGEKPFMCVVYFKPNKKSVVGQLIKIIEAK